MLKKFSPCIVLCNKNIIYIETKKKIMVKKFSPNACENQNKSRASVADRVYMHDLLLDISFHQTELTGHEEVYI